MRRQCSARGQDNALETPKALQKNRRQCKETRVVQSKDSRQPKKPKHINMGFSFKDLDATGIVLTIVQK
jgi:hypothetical protein